MHSVLGPAAVLLRGCLSCGLWVYIGPLLGSLIGFVFLAFLSGPMRGGRWRAFIVVE